MTLYILHRNGFHISNNEVISVFDNLKSAQKLMLENFSNEHQKYFDQLLGNHKTLTIKENRNEIYIPYTLYYKISPFEVDIKDSNKVFVVSAEVYLDGYEAQDELIVYGAYIDKEDAYNKSKDILKKLTFTDQEIEPYINQDEVSIEDVIDIKIREFNIKR